MKAGRPVDAPAGSVAADSLAPRQVGALMFPLAQAHVERVVLVTDAAILEAQQAMWEGMRIVAEAGASAAFAALLSGAYRPAQGERVGVVVSGANTTAVDFTPRPCLVRASLHPYERRGRVARTGHRCQTHSPTTTASTWMANPASKATMATMEIINWSNCPSRRNSIYLARKTRRPRAARAGRYV